MQHQLPQRRTDFEKQHKSNRVINIASSDREPVGTSSVSVNHTSKVIFWNVHGIANIEDIKQQFDRQDILCLYETWIVEWGPRFNAFSNSMDIYNIPAVREARKGRAKGGVTIVLDKSYYSSQLIMIESNFMVIKVQANGFFFLLVVVYAPPSIDFPSFLSNFNLKLSVLRDSFVNYPVIVGGDFNCRVANLNSVDKNILSTNSRLNCYRISRDMFCNLKGKQLSDCLEGVELLLCNGRSLSDTPANYTYIGSTGSSVIDLVWCSLSLLPYIRDFIVLNIVTCSDHLPVCVTLDLLSPPYTPVNDNCQSRKLKFDHTKATEFTENMR